MEIKVEVDPTIWQKFEMLATGKDRSQVFSDLVEAAWTNAPDKLKAKRGETVAEE